MKSLTRLFLGSLPVALVLISAIPAQAQFVAPTNSLATISETAGATLLAPYFEVDLNNATGMNTIISIANTGASVSYNGGSSYSISGPTAVLAHVTIWSDLAVPVFNFNVYLTGYDAQKIDMRRVLSGWLPSSASAGQDPGDALSPKGAFSQDINFASCYVPLINPPNNFSSPYLPPPASLTTAQVENMVKSLTGQASPESANQCAGRNLNDNVARGYVTIDTVNNCTSRFPSDAGYLVGGGSGDTTDQVQLTGEVYYIDLLHSVGYGNNLVHIHADATDPLTTTPGNYTFYGRYDAWTAVDNRQPLPTNFSARFLKALFIVPGSGPAPTPAALSADSVLWGAARTGPNSVGPGTLGTSKLIVWRDPKVAQGYFTCGTDPSWYPLGQEAVIAYDEQEHPQMTGPSLTYFSTPFPAATQIVTLGSAAFPVTLNKGWVSLDLNTTVVPAGSNPPIDPASSQAWVQVVEQSADGTLNLMHNATAVDSGTIPSHALPY